jgi:hypothetical protein
MAAHVGSTLIAARNGHAFIPLAKLHQAVPKIEQRAYGRISRQD